MNDLKNFDYWHRVISYLFLYVFAGVVMMLLFQITIIIQYGSFHAMTQIILFKLYWVECEEV